MRRFLIAALLLAASSALAQETMSPREQALFEKVQAEMTQAIRFRAAIITLQAEVKALKDKYEPPEKPKPE